MEDAFIHAAFTSAVFRFFDDVEFYLDDDTKTIHMRSASRGELRSWREQKTNGKRQESLYISNGEKGVK